MHKCDTQNILTFADDSTAAQPVLPFPYIQSNNLEKSWALCCLQCFDHRSRALLQSKVMLYQEEEDKVIWKS